MVLQGQSVPEDEENREVWYIRGRVSLRIRKTGIVLQGIRDRVSLRIRKEHVAECRSSCFLWPKRLMYTSF